MPESVDAWWARRQFSKGREVPYAVGTFRSDWERYPVLIRQYHPEFNRFVTLTQVPPAAEVFLTWECDVGHRFVATPEEQRNRPGRERRRSSWCPECAELAVARPRRSLGLTAGAAAGTTPPTPAAKQPRPGLPCGHPRTRDRTGCAICRHAAAGAARVPVGGAFVSTWAPKPASAVEADLRQRIAERYEFDLAPNAIRVAQPFFAHLEVWPDIVIAELAIAIELDTVGRHGLEHVGRRETIDRRKDRMTRAAGWEVIRIRLGKLQPLGPFDVCASGVTKQLMPRIDDQLAAIRGELIVSAYRRRATSS